MRNTHSRSKSSELLLFFIYYIFSIFTTNIIAEMKVLIQSRSLEGLEKRELERQARDRGPGQLRKLVPKELDKQVPMRACVNGAARLEEQRPRKGYRKRGP